MTARAVERLTVVGSGTMGSQISLVAAMAGIDTRLTDAQPEQLERALANNRRLLERRVEKGQQSAADRDSALARLTTTTDLGAAVAGADFVIEAVFEDLEVKRRVFRQLDAVCPPQVVLASNSSSIAISDIVAGLAHPERAVNMHFFHPVLVMRLVEVVKGRASTRDAVDTAMALGKQMGKVPVLLTKEIAGFIVNRILHSLMREAMWLAEEGYASVEDIDRAVKFGLNHPMGPFELADFSGLDITYNSWKHTFDITGDSTERPPRILEEKVKAGQLGRKTGKGFYDYPS